MTQNPIVFYGVSTLLLFVTAVGVILVVYGLRRLPGEWRVMSSERRRKAIVGTIVLAIFYAIVALSIVTVAWKSAAHGQEVAVTPRQGLAPGLPTVDLETTRATQERPGAAPQAAAPPTTNTVNTS